MAMGRRLEAGWGLARLGSNPSLAALTLTEVSMSKDRRRRGRKRRPGEREKRVARLVQRKVAWSRTGNGAGSRSIDDPGRHHR